MGRTSNPQLVRQWRERLQRFHHAELTVAEFCQSEGYSVASFYRWRCKLQAALPSVQRRAGDQQAASFVSVELQPGTFEPAQPAGLQIELPGGAIARLDHDATDEQQCRLIKNVVQSLTEVTS